MLCAGAGGGTNSVFKGILFINLSQHRQQMPITIYALMREIH